MMSPFDAARMFFAIRLHFTRASYDYFKYHGKTTLTQAKFELRPDRFVFAKLARLYQTPEQYQDLLVANCLFDPHLYSRMLVASEAYDRYLAYRKVHESLMYQVEQDTRWLHDQTPNLNEWIYVHQEYPLLLTAVWSHRIALETLIVLNRVLNFFPMWKSKIRDTIRAPEFLFTCEKYDPFVVVDVGKSKQLLRKNLTVTV